MSIKWVGQKHSHGCLVACLAMIAGLTYDEVRDAWPTLAADKCLSAADAHKWLQAQGFEATTRLSDCFRNDKASPWPPEPWTQIHLVSVSPFSGANTGHSVIMLADGTILDPETPELRKISDYGHVNSIASVEQMINSAK